VRKRKEEGREEGNESTIVVLVNFNEQILKLIRYLGSDF
jgi:hypothetical protein